MGLKIISPNTVYLGSATGSGGGGGGSSSLPIIVKNSGSSLPSASSYQIGDTFLNTSTKKIYTPVVNGYIANPTSPKPDIRYITVDYNTGIATNFVLRCSCLRQTSPSWLGTDLRNFNIKFILNNIVGDIALFSSYTGWHSPSQENASFYIVDGSVYHCVVATNNGIVESVMVEPKKILDTVLETNTVYVLKIQKTGTDCVAQLTLEDGTVIEEKSFTTVNLSNSGNYIGNNIGYANKGSGGKFYAESNIEVYLAESVGQILIPNTSTLSWDNGTDIVNNTEYVDKTNEILYIYENSELFAINKPNSFAQITGQPTSNSNLATALNGKQAVANSVTYGSASLSFSISANKHYVLSNSALTSITFSSCEKSFDETTIEFTTGATPPSVTDNSGITWMDNFDITNLSANKSYLIVIFNKLGFVKEY